MSYVRSSNLLHTGRRPWRAVAVAVAAAAGATCGGDSLGPSRAPVATVAIAPPSASVTVGQELPLQATIKDADGQVLTGRDLFWTSKDTTVVAVSETGVITGMRVGTTQIAASAEGESGLATVTVFDTPVASVVIVPDDAVGSVGSTIQLQAITYDASGNVLTGRSVVWASGNQDVATVDADGRVRAAATGRATITATSEGESGQAQITVAATPVASVTIAPANLSLTAGQSKQLTATVTDASGNKLEGRAVEWSSSDGDVATVSGTGMVTGVAAGNATITATSEGKRATAAVQVSAASVPVASVAVTPSAVDLEVGETTTLTAQPQDASGKPLTGRDVTWSSDKTGVATVSSSGVVTAVSKGTATITAESEGKRGQATVSVTEPAPERQPVASVDVEPDDATIAIGETVQLRATPKDAEGHTLTGRDVSWQSSDPSVATVSSSGVVVGVREGKATITATSEGKSGNAAITVEAPAPVPVAKVTVEPSHAYLRVGDAIQLTPTVEDADGNVLTDREVTWQSSSLERAIVSPTGRVFGVSPGDVTITATSEGRSGTSKIKVKLFEVDRVTVKLGRERLAAGETTQATATLLDASGNVLTGRSVAWASNESDVATISESGLVQALAEGSSTIMATADGERGSATVTVEKKKQSHDDDHDDGGDHDDGDDGHHGGRHGGRGHP